MRKLDYAGRREGASRSFFSGQCQNRERADHVSFSNRSEKALPFYSLQRPVKLLDQTCPALSGQAIARNASHDFAESIQFPQRRVNVRCDAQADEFFVNDWRREDVMLTKEVAADLSLIQSFNLDVRDGAHLARIE